MTPEQISPIIAQIQTRLSQLGGAKGVNLQVDTEDTKLEDDWLYVCVSAPKASIRVSDYADILSEIEKELRAESIQNVLLVPARAA